MVLGNGVFLFAKPPKGRRGFEKIKVEWSRISLWLARSRCLILGCGVLLGFDAGAEFPDEGGEFAGDGYFDFVVMELALFEHFETVTQAGLGFPGEFFDPGCGTFLAGGKLSADFGWDAVVGGLFDEDPAGMGVAAFANAASFLFGPAGVFGGDEAEEGHEFLGVLEAAEGSDFRYRDHGGDMLESFESHECVDEWLALPVVQELEHAFFEFGDTFDMEVDGGDVVFEDAVVGFVRKSEMTKVALVSFSPVGFAIVVVAQTTEHGEKSGLGPAKIVDGIGAGAAKVADGFVGGIGDVDRDEVIGAEVFGEFHGITLVGFNAVAGFHGDE